MKVRIKKRESSPSKGSLPKWLLQPQMGHAKDRTKELCLDLSCGYRGPRLWPIHSPLLFQGQKQGFGSELMPIWDADATGGILSTMPWHQLLPFVLCFKQKEERREYILKSLFALGGRKPHTSWVSRKPGSVVQPWFTVVRSYVPRIWGHLHVYFAFRLSLGFSRFVSDCSSEEFKGRNTSPQGVDSLRTGRKSSGFQMLGLRWHCYSG